MVKVVVERRSRTKAILLTFAAVLFVIFVIIPLSLVVFDGKKLGNVALIPVVGVITGDGSPAPFGSSSVSSRDIVAFIEEADANPGLTAIVLEINSPGGSAVASDEIAAAVKKAEKPVVALIREAGASGAYWIASAADHVVANKMSITGSIGVISSYLEFSGLMEKYGIRYEPLTSGQYKDVGNPYQPLDSKKKALLQGKLDKIHAYFIEEVARNRQLSEDHVRKLATGEFFLGVEAKELGLVDELGDQQTVQTYLREKHGLLDIVYVPFEKERGFFEMLAGISSSFSFEIGKGIGAAFMDTQSPETLMLLS
ncbi:signal peptide peptidase SppA [Candidatus Woesearchaeota archaeon]|nr:signal peptide peptidase SppA [Candidatus Woesearchaeota archaeon]